MRNVEGLTQIKITGLEKRTEPKHIARWKSSLSAETLLLLIKVEDKK